MHTPIGEAKAARAALQSIYDRVLRHICEVRHAPSAVLLEELALSPLQIFWWQQTLEFWNMIAASPVGSLSTRCYLTTFMVLFMRGVVLRIPLSLFVPLPLACSLLGIPCLVIAMLFLSWRLLSLLWLCVKTYVVLTVMPYTVLGQPRLLGLSAALTITDLILLASVGDTASCLFLVGVCNAFYTSGLGLTTCLLLSVNFPGTGVLQEPTGYEHTVVALLLPTSYTWFTNAQSFSHLGYNMLLYLPQATLAL